MAKTTETSQSSGLWWNQRGAHIPKHPEKTPENPSRCPQWMWLRKPWGRKRDDGVRGTGCALREGETRDYYTNRPRTVSFSDPKHRCGAYLFQPTTHMRDIAVQSLCCGAKTYLRRRKPLAMTLNEGHGGVPEKLCMSQGVQTDEAVGGFKTFTGKPKRPGGGGSSPQAVLYSLHLSVSLTTKPNDPEGPLRPWTVSSTISGYNLHWILARPCVSHPVEVLAMGLRRTNPTKHQYDHCPLRQRAGIGHPSVFSALSGSGGGALPQNTTPKSWLGPVSAANGFASANLTFQGD